MLLSLAEARSELVIGFGFVETYSTCRSVFAAVTFCSVCFSVSFPQVLLDVSEKPTQGLRLFFFYFLVYLLWYTQQAQHRHR